MKAVWSFWSVPYVRRCGQTWSSSLHHLLAWSISLRAASRHYPETVLVTDRLGKKLLVDELGLPFTQVSEELECLRGADPQWWALGKLTAYAMQDQPFVHLDTDVFLWDSLPATLLEAPVFAQCPEYFPPHERGTRDVEHAFSAANLDLPREWSWATSRNDAFVREENCGILGGTRTDFIRHYAQTAIDLVMRAEHEPAWSRCGSRANTVIEQFLLAACADFHRNHPSSPYRGVTVRYMFPSWEEAVDPNCATRAGFTHLLGGSKAHPAVSRRMEERVQREDPAQFRRCLKVAEKYPVS